MQVLPAWLQPILGIAVPELRELIEMRLQTNRPYYVDAGKFQARFGQEATSFEEGLAATVHSIAMQRARLGRKNFALTGALGRDQQTTSHLRCTAS